MSFGAFMEGLQGGVKSGQGIRRERQLDDIYDAARRKIENEETADNIGRKARNLPMGSETSLGDPLGQRIWDWASGLFKGGDDAATAVPDPGAAALQEKTQRIDSLTPEDGVANPQGAGLIPYADGGQPPTEEELRKQKAERYGTTPRQLASDFGNATGAAMRAIPAAAKWGVHKVADAIDVGTDDPVDNYAEGAFDTPRVLAGQAVRAFGDFVGGDIPFYDETGGAKKQAVPTPTAPGQATGPSNPRRYHGQGSASAKSSSTTAIPAPGAAPAAPAAPAAKAPEQSVMAPDVIKKIPWDKVDPMSLPKFKTQDWVKYRETAIDQMVMRGGGITVADAMDKVDQQVIAMQQRGTKALLQEAIMRVQSGDLKGAGNALVQMFQYVPSGTDAVVGTYNGQLVAQFIDEQTGQPVGEPTPVDAKMLGDLWQQYANPAAWAAMAQDRARLAEEQKRTGLMEKEVGLRERLLEEVQIPEAQSNADYRAMLGQASVAKAIGGSGSDGLKPGETINYDEDVRKVVEGYAMQQTEDGEPLDPRLQDPKIREALLIAVMKQKRATGRPSEDILREILSLAEE